MLLLLNLIILLSLNNLVQSKLSHYKNHKIIELINTHKIKEICESINLDILSSHGKKLKIRVSPSQLDKLKLKLPKSVNFNVLDHDIQMKIDEEANKLSTNKESDDWFCNYHSFEEIRNWFINHTESNPEVVKYNSSIGKTIENNDIFAVHLVNANTKPKYKIWFQSLIHAREWISGTTNQFIFDKLLKNRENDPEIKEILEDVEIIFIPVANPDGFIYTHQTERLWRKNRNQMGGGDGVDLNRNFASNWGGLGASSDPSNEKYCGPSAESELEVKAITNYFKAQGPISGAIDWHSFGELILRPWGYTEEDSPHDALHKQLGSELVNIIKLNRGKEYKSEKAIGLYPTSGTARDWFYGTGKAYGYTIELTPNENSTLDFILPSEEIKLVGDDLFKAALHFIKFVKANPL